VTGYGMENRDSIPGMGKIFSSFPEHPDWLRGPPSLLSNEKKR
jgi:hypothetical protein